ncbi:hypothetical protein ONZ45_g5035 [Pleurotus djamor]|nr:hypothetical protein ONZ45_g5035 [Pleurotus djamor]
MNSVDHVSGIPIRLKDSLQVEDDAEHDAFNESLEILFSRDNWVELLVNIWKRLDDEKLEDVARMFKRVTKDHIPTKTPDEMSFNCVFEYRGISRTCVLRVIALATYTSNPALISNADLFALLRLAYLGCQRTRAAKPVELFTSQQDLWANLEIRYDIMRDPLYSVSLPVSTEPVQVVPQMLVMAPIALVRILTLIAQRGLLDKIPHWRKLPEGCSKSVSLVQVMQMTGLSVVEKSLKAAMKAVAPRREMGTKFMKEGNLDWAASTYASSAELAAAILAFDEATDGKWSHHLAGAREEIVKSLGNASEMAFQRRKYRRALRFATGAVSIAEAAPSSKPINPALVMKNKRRMEASSAQMKA